MHHLYNKLLFNKPTDMLLNISGKSSMQWQQLNLVDIITLINLEI